MAPSDMNSSNSTPELDGNVAQLRIPDSMAVEDVVPKHLREFLWRKNQARLDQARRLNLDLGTLSISPKTSLILFHSLTDEEMDVHDSDNDGSFKAHDLAVWTRFLNSEEKGFSEMLQPMAHRIVEEGFRPSESTLTAAVMSQHRFFILKTYPIDIAISILKPKVPSTYRPHGLRTDEPEWLKGSEKTGRVTTDDIRLSLLDLCLCPISQDCDDWIDFTVTPVMASLERFGTVGKLTRMSFEKLETLRNHLPLEAPAVIREYLDTLPEDKQVQYWAGLLDDNQRKYGQYKEHTPAYLRCPEKLEEKVQQKRSDPMKLVTLKIPMPPAWDYRESSSDTMEEEISMSTMEPPSQDTSVLKLPSQSTTKIFIKLKRRRPRDDDGLSPTPKRPSLGATEAIPARLRSTTPDSIGWD